MPAKRNSDAMEPTVLGPLNTTTLNVIDGGELTTTTKKARTSTKSKKPAASSDTSSSNPETWQDIRLDGEDEGEVPVYDDCAEVRRKIRLLQKTPGWKVTHWLQEIGDINSNSFRRFMSAKGKNDGAANGTYYAAYIYFEKVRILEGKKKTAKRVENEAMQANGFPLCNPPRYLWVPHH